MARELARARDADAGAAEATGGRPDPGRPAPLPVAAGNRAFAAAVRRGRLPGRRRVQRAIEKDAEDFQFDDFGYFEYRFRWKASAPHVDGCIVQKIERSATVDGEQIIDEPYWEAWEVAGGEILGPDGKKLTAGAHDSWVNLERKWGTSGEWRIDATVYWVPREEWAALAAKFGANAVPAAGMLLATTSDPGLSGGALFTHWKGGAWDGRTVEAARNLLRKWRAEGTFPLNDEGEEDHGQAAHELKEDNEFASEVVAEAIAELDKG